MKKITKMNEAAWLLGTVLCTLGVCLCTKANFGLSMIAAPAYTVHIFMSQFFSWYTQGTSEYIWQGIVLIIMCVIIGRFKPRYLLSFATAVFSGLTLDGWLFIFGGNGAYESFTARVIAFVLGVIITAAAIAFLFRTTMPIQVYELAVCEISARYSLDKGKVKWVNDFILLAVAIVLTVVLQTNWRGIGIGTVVITFVNAPLIALFGKIYDKIFEFDSMFARKK